MGLASQTTANNKTVAAARTWLTANKDSVELLSHPMERWLQSLHLQALDSSLLANVTFLWGLGSPAAGSVTAFLKQVRL